MTVCLVVGMKYLKHQEERLDKMSRQEAEGDDNQNVLDENEGFNDVWFCHNIPKYSLCID